MRLSSVDYEMVQRVLEFPDSQEAAEFYKTVSDYYGKSFLNNSMSQTTLKGYFSDMVEDASQDFLIRVLNNLPDYKKEIPFAGWLSSRCQYFVRQFMSVQWLPKRDVRKTVHLSTYENPGDTLFAYEGNHETQIENREVVDLIFSKLPEKYSEILWLSAVHYHSTTRDGVPKKCGIGGGYLSNILGVDKSTSWARFKQAMKCAKEIARDLDV